MKTWVMAIGMMFWLVSCSGQEAPGGQAELSTPLEYADSVQSTDLSSELGGVGMLGARRQEVTAARGEPLMTGDIVINGRKQRSAIMEYADYHYAFEDDLVCSITIMPGISTAKGIAAGDDDQRIAEAYGPHYNARQMGKAEVWGYVDKEHDAVMEFVLNDSKIEMITISRLSSFR